MNFEFAFLKFARKFQDSPPVTTAESSAQIQHAENVVRWLDLTEKLKDQPRGRMKHPADVLRTALKSAESLFALGDDISAWVGQQHIVEAASKHLDNGEIAFHLGWAARFSAFLHQAEDADTFLDRMAGYFPETYHPLAAQYRGLRGLTLRIQGKWEEAIPHFQLSLEHLEHTSPDEIKRWFHEDRENLMVNRLLHLADCWINMGWSCDGVERNKAATRARRLLKKAEDIPSTPLESYLAGLNAMELAILEDRPDVARSGLDQMVSDRSLNSRRAATLRPGAYCLLARIAEMEDDQTGMINHLSKALAESTRFPDALQELLVVDYALNLIRTRALRRDQLEPLMEAMVVMLEAKDWYTGRNHSKQVADMSMKLWQHWQDKSFRLHLNEDLYWAAYLHDIGKLKLPRSLLNKIGPLCDAEWRLLHKHPDLGRTIVEDFGVRDIAHWIGEHHQNARGSGYPGNQPASEIGMCIAVADYLEASTSPNRRYKKPKSISQAMNELDDFGRDLFPGGLLMAANNVCRSS